MPSPHLSPHDGESCCRASDHRALDLSPDTVPLVADGIRAALAGYRRRKLVADL